MIKQHQKEKWMPDFNKYDEYKLFVEDTARFTERRQTISNIYITVNSLLLAAIGLLIKDLCAKGVWIILLPLPLVVAGFAVSLWWRQLIRKYKALIGIRIGKLREMENDFSGSIKMFHCEDILYPRNDQGEMIPGKGLNFADHEARLPILFMVLYILFGIGLLMFFLIRVLCFRSFCL
jgi:hypothetical protein